jgi:hypothetical protein
MDSLLAARRVGPTGKVIGVDLCLEMVEKAGRNANPAGPDRPQVIVGSSRGGAVAMNINSGGARLVLLCPAWKTWGDARTVKAVTVILHSRADDVVPFADSEELVRNSGLAASALIEVGDDHRLADPELLEKMLRACEGLSAMPRR